MKKFTALITIGSLMLAAMTGCGKKDSGTVSTDGSTSMEKVIGALGESFEENNSGVTFTYNPTGSGSGITAVAEGRCDIGLSSRNLKDEEKAQGLAETVLALDGIAIIVNPENPVNDLALDTIGKIYMGEITNWKDIGGNDLEIVLIGREAGSGTRDGFESITGTEDACKYRQELTSTGDVMGAVAGNPAAIGYASLASVKETVKALLVGGIAPTEDTVKDGSYVVQRPFVLVTKSSTDLSETAQKFFDYITSPLLHHLLPGGPDGGGERAWRILQRQSGSGAGLSGMRDGCRPGKASGQSHQYRGRSRERGGPGLLPGAPGSAGKTGTEPLRLREDKGACPRREPGAGDRHSCPGAGIL